MLKSTGPAAKNQAACLGVYRVVDSHNDRPVYKQDCGDHYLYYDYDCWMVGSRKGDAFGWIKNERGGRGEAGGSVIPDLQKGWQYQPVARADNVDGTWLADDDSLTVEILKGELTN